LTIADFASEEFLADEDCDLVRAGATAILSGSESNSDASTITTA
jgi:hypothetical protein